MTLLNNLQILHKLTGRNDWAVSGVFGEMAKPRTKPHTGTDYKTPEGTPLMMPTINTEIMSIRSDINRSSATTSFGADYGNFTVIWVPEWNRTYATSHEMFQANTQKPGIKLTEGAVYSKTGNTGLSTGPHLHISAAVGKHDNINSVLANAIDFEKDVIHISPIGNPVKPSKPVDKMVVLPKGTILFKADGTAYPKGTSKSHTVHVTEVRGDLQGFSAGWLEGTTFAYFKEPKTNEKPVVEIPNLLGKTITIPKGYKLRKPDGTTYPKATSKAHSVKVSQVMKNGLLKFSAPWLEGVQVAYVKESDFKK